MTPAADQESAFITAEIRQSRGPTLEFEGKLLACTEWTTKGPDATDIRLELWVTRGGAYVPVTRREPLDRGRREIVSATVVEPTDEAMMRFAVMDFWDWTDGARSMVSKELGWVLKRIVE